MQHKKKDFIMKKTSLLFVCAALAAGTLQAAPPTVKQSIYNGWGQDQMALRENITLANDHNFYTITLAQWKPKGNQGPQTQFWLFEPRTYNGFSRPIMDFVRLEVNGISEIKLQPKKEDIRTWRNNGRAGADITLNYDGAKIIMSWYLRPDSPVLWCSIKPAPDTLEPVKSIQLKISAIPSKLAKGEKGGVIWNNGYQRQAVTPARTIEQDEKAVSLTSADSWVILQDGKFDGSGKDKGDGPCVIVPGYENAVSTTLNLQNCWINGLNIQIKPDFKEFQFGLWQQKNPLTNADAAKMLKEKAEQFQIK